MLYEVITHQLAGAVGIDRLLRVALVDRAALGHAVGGAGAGEHQLADAVVAHCFEQAQRAGDVVAVVLARVGDRLADA